MFQARMKICMSIFGSFYSITEVLVRATPLILAGLGVAVAFQAVDCAEMTYVSSYKFQLPKADLVVKEDFMWG